MQTITVPYVLDQLTHSTVWVGVGAFCHVLPGDDRRPAGRLAGRPVRPAHRPAVLAGACSWRSALALWGIWVDAAWPPRPLIVGCVIGRRGRRRHHHRGVAGVRPAARAAGGAHRARCASTACSSPARARSGRRWPGWSSREFGPGTAFLANALSFLLVIGALLLIAPRPIAVVDRGRGRGRRTSATACATSASARCSSSSVLGALFSSLLGVSMIQLAEPFARQVLARRRGRVRAARRGVRRRRDHRLRRHRRARRRGAALDAHARRLRDLRRRRAHVRARAGVRARARRACSASAWPRCFAMVSCQTAVQVNVDEHYRGRVLSIYVMCFFAGTPIGALVGGHRRRVDRAPGHHRRLGRAPRRHDRSSRCCGTRGSACSTRAGSASTATRRTARRVRRARRRSRHRRSPDRRAARLAALTRRRPSSGRRR